MRFLILIFLLIVSCKENKAKATDTKSVISSPAENNNNASAHNWSGEWIYQKKQANADVPEEQFTLTIIQEGNSIKAQYCAIANSGGKIDCESEQKYNVIGNIKDDKIVGEFFSFFGAPSDKGEFEISLIDDKIHWKVIKAPKGTFYAPDDCVLTKKEHNYTATKPVSSSGNEAVDLLPVDYKDLENQNKIKFTDHPEDWLKKAFMDKFDLTADASAKILSKDGYDLYIVNNVGGDSELIYLVSAKGNAMLNGINVADSNGDSETTKTFSIDAKNTINIFSETGGRRSLIEKYAYNLGKFEKK
ncbi:hypothetical protein [Chryseobacterium sp. POE27]|uniref:hypothetical protein n=1 Tax=Chryseobacterium sp. POE27 TaxID=3138177 RepID=UPI00321A4874